MVILTMDGTKFVVDLIVSSSVLVFAMKTQYVVPRDPLLIRIVHALLIILQRWIRKWYQDSKTSDDCSLEIGLIGLYLNSNSDTEW